MMVKKYRMLSVALALALLISAVPLGAGPMAAVGDVIHNGGFEKGFTASVGCGGMVGDGWGCFTNGGAAAYGFYDDMWAPVVHAGEHSQLIEINTRQVGGDADRNAGIYQTMRVWPHAQYELSLKGMIRAEDHGGDPWRYRVYVGFDYHGGADWQAVTNWQELPWDAYYDRLSPGSFSSYTAKVKPTTDKLTVFIRLQRKWGDWYEETDLNLDSISLFGPVKEPPKPTPAPKPKADDSKTAYDHQRYDDDKRYDDKADDHEMDRPAAAAIVCDGPNLLKNGGFENGFSAAGVARYWHSFNNGGHVNYGYYDDMWPPVVSQGAHSQLIEINTLDVGDTTEPDRMSGIYQKVWLKPGATYQLSFDSMMRERTDHSDEDFYRYMVEWGYSKNGGVAPAQMDFRDMVPLSAIHLRTAPGDMEPYSVRFKAPSAMTTLWLFATKKWATLERELDVNIDNVALRYCKSTPLPPPRKIDVEKYVSVDHKATWYDADYPSGPVAEVGSDVYFKYVVTNRSDVALSHIKLTDNKYVISGCWVYDPLPPGKSFHCVSGPFPADSGQHTNRATVTGVYGYQAYSDSDYANYYGKPTKQVDKHDWCGAPGDVWYVVKAGDTMHGLAWTYNTTVAAIMAKNNIADPSWIYVGQVLCISDPPGATAQAAPPPAMPAPPAPPSQPAAPASQPVTDDSAGQPTTYRVQYGDTLSGIAAQFGVTIEALMAANGLSNANWIYAGQSLQIPGN